MKIDEDNTRPMEDDPIAEVGDLTEILVAKAGNSFVSFHGSKLSTFGLISIGIISVDSIKNLPFNAALGFTSMFFYILLGIFFFLPLALVTQEFATKYNSTGGSYLWVKSAFGMKWAFISMWLQWVGQVIWYPTGFTFVATTLLAMIDESLVNNKGYLVLICFVLFALITLISMRGVEATSFVSVICSIFGTLFPMSAIIILGIVWMSRGEKVGTELSAKTFFPSGDSIDNLNYFGTILFSLQGIEVIAMHAKEVENPKKSYPIALAVAGTFIISSMALSTLFLAVIVDHDTLNSQLAEGVINVFSICFDSYGMSWATYFMGVFLIMGTLGVASSWIIGLARGMAVAFKDSGVMPDWIIKKNRYDIPSRILVMQGCIYVVLLLIMLFIPDAANTFYALLQILSTQFSLYYYIVLFFAVIKLQRKKNGRYTIGSLCMTIFPILCCLAGIALEYIPPPAFSNAVTFEIELIAGQFVFFCPVIAIFFLAKKHHNVVKSSGDNHSVNSAAVVDFSK